MIKNYNRYAMNSYAISESIICKGCLSVERKLQLLNEECKQTFCGLLEVFDHSQPLSLCFECVAFLKRALRFKSQVQQAHSYLSDYQVPNTPTSLSQLVCRNTVHVDTSSDTQTDITNDNIIHSKGRKLSKQDGISNTYYDVIKHEKCFDQKPKNYDQNLNESNQKNTEPVAFIKVERADVDQEPEDDHNYGVIDQGGDDHDGADQDLKGVKECKESAYTESDEEPLTVQSQRHRDTQEHGRDTRGSRSVKKRKEQASGVVSDPRVTRKLRDLNVGDGHIALVMLTWEEVEEERHLARQSAQFTRHAHRCAPCAVGFNHRHKLNEHNAKHSPEAGSEVCEVCSVRCKTRAALASHRRRHRARWVCQVCGARYSQACVAADHSARAHGTPPATHRCAHCAHTATSLGALRMHIKSHSARPECALCGKSFRDKSSLRTHAFVHRGEKEHACSVCDKRFMFKKQKEIHEITHLEHQHLYCHQCDVSFKNQTSYYQHMKYNLKHIDPADIKHACAVCGKRFVKAKRLEEHNLAVHLKLSPIKCTAPDCTYACPSRAALRSHARLVHRGARSRRTHVCHRCGNMFKSKKSLEGHLRSHKV